VSSLPVLPDRPPPPSREDLLRLFDKTDFRLAQQFGEEEQLSCAAAFASAAFPTARAANHVREAWLPPGTTPAEAVGEVERFFETRRTRCLYWRMNRSAPQERVAPLTEHLKGLGYRPDATDVMHLSRTPRGVIREAGGVTIIPARASYRHARALAEEAARERGIADVSAAAAIHEACVDNPQCDAMLALKDGRAIGRVYVTSVGDLGRVDNLFVLAAHRRHGVGRTLMSRALESCARSLFAQVFLNVDADNAAALSLYRLFGFERIGESVQYRAPAIG
jgi:GNAT superfamily N-acetyltransferase